MTSYGNRWLHCEGSPELLFTENETNARRLFGVENRTPYVKDGINDYVVHGASGCGESGACRHKGRRPLQAHGRCRARRSSSACA